MNRLLTNLSAEIKQLFPKIVEIRRHLHRYPELSFEEYKQVPMFKNSWLYLTYLMRWWQILVSSP